MTTVYSEHSTTKTTFICVDSTENKWWQQCTLNIQHEPTGWILLQTVHFTYSTFLLTPSMCSLVLVSCWPRLPTSIPHHLQNSFLVFEVAFPGWLCFVVLLICGVIWPIALALCSGKTLPPRTFWSFGFDFGFVWKILDSNFIPCIDLERILSCANWVWTNLTVSSTRVLIPVNCKEDYQGVHH